jgi:hypothetical protein
VTASGAPFAIDEFRAADGSTHSNRPDHHGEEQTWDE